jgi:hypothetical protein
MSEYGPYSTEEDAQAAYRETLDEIYETVEFGYLHYQPSQVLEAVDPIAFREGFNNWLDDQVSDYEENRGDINPYQNPEAAGLELVGEVEWSARSYEFDLTAVWRDATTGAFYWASDSGCSCPSPFENTTFDDLHTGTKFEALAELTSNNNPNAMNLIERIMGL